MSALNGMSGTASEEVFPATLRPFLQAGQAARQQRAAERRQALETVMREDLPAPLVAAAVLDPQELASLWSAGDPHWVHATITLPGCAPLRVRYAWSEQEGRWRRLVYLVGRPWAVCAVDEHGRTYDRHFLPSLPEALALAQELKQGQILDTLLSPETQQQATQVHYVPAEAIRLWHFISQLVRQAMRHERGRAG